MENYNPASIRLPWTDQIKFLNALGRDGDKEAGTAGKVSERKCNELWKVVKTLDECTGPQLKAMVEANGYDIGDGKGKLNKDDQVPHMSRF